MRGLKLLLTSLTILLAICGPTFAQSAPAADQYGVQSKSCDPDLGETQVNADAGDGACASAENAGQGTDAVNDALTGTNPSSGASVSASPSAPAESVSSSAGASSRNAASGAEGDADDASADARAEGDGGQASITELPETGGASPAALGLGIALVSAGLLARGVWGR